MLKQTEKYGCGLYAVANALDLPNFVTPERIELSKNGNIIGQLSKYLQDDGINVSIDAMFYDHTGASLPPTTYAYRPFGDVDYLPVLLNIKYSAEGKRHLVSGHIDKEGVLVVYDSLINKPEITTLEKYSKSLYSCFGLFIFMDLNSTNYLFLKNGVMVLGSDKK